MSTVLENSVQELGELQTELEERVKMVEKLKEEAGTGRNNNKLNRRTG